MVKGFKEQILQLRKEGKTYKEIREILGCTKSVISYHCKNAGLEHQNARNYPSFDIIELANSLYEQGKTLMEISIATKKSRHSIKKYIKNYNSKKYIKNISRSQSVVNWRKRTRRELIGYKGGKCKICGYNTCMEALDFHHLNPLEKDFTISGKSWSFETLKKEVDKCELLCRNCHTEVHQGLHKDKGL